MKKIITAILSAVLAGASVLSAVGCNDDSSASAPKKLKDVVLWGATNTESIMADEPIRENAPDLEFTAMKGETESDQFIMTSTGEKDVIGYNVTASELTNKAGGDPIPASAIEIFNQKYIRVTRNSWIKNANRTAPMYTGYYPDALIPMDRAVVKRENRMSQNFNQGIWVNVNVPQNAAAGDYEGKITVSLGSEKIDVPISLHVYDLTMPTAVHAQSMYAIWYDLIEKGEGTTSLELEESYYQYLVSRRINPTAVPASGYTDYESFADYIVSYAQDERVTRYQLPAIIYAEGSSYKLDAADVKARLVAMAEKQKELRAAGDTTTDLFAKAFWYTIDEPDYTGHMADVPEVEKALVQVKEEVAALYPEFADSILKIAHPMVTQYLHPENAGSDEEGGIQTWCSQLHRFESDQKIEADGREMTPREFIEWRRSNPDNKAAGEDIWWYHCNQPENPYPTAMLDDNLIAMRLVTWMQYDLDITGTLYWSVNYYQKLETAIVPRDIWNDPVTMGRSNGDGYLLYPGSSYGIDGPIGTLRLESIRESKEDYEYFWMLEQKIAELNEKYSESFDAREILSASVKKMVKNDVIPIIDGGKENTTFIAERNAVLTLLEKVYSDDETALAALRAL